MSEKRDIFLVKAWLFESLFRLRAILHVKPKIQHQLQYIAGQCITQFGIDFSTFLAQRLSQCTTLSKAEA